MIAASAAAIVLVLRPDSSSGTDNGAASATSDSEFASANDTGPANLITEDPTCGAWGRISREYVAEAESAGWPDHDPATPAARWTPDLRSTYERVGSALTDAANLAGNLQKQTPHRGMRELYGQFIAYSQAFVNRIPNYESADDNLANATTAFISAISNICSAITYDATQSIAPLISEPKGPSVPPSSSDATERFLATKSAACPEWTKLTDEYAIDTKDWRAIPAKIPAPEWTPEQKAVYEAAGPVMSAYADKYEELGRGSDNPTMEDFAVLSAQYTRAYVAALPEYTVADNYLSQAGLYLSNAVHWACKAST